MIIENLKKIFVKNKISKNKKFYEKLRNLDKSITDLEAIEIMLKVSPENTELIKIKSESEFLKWITVESFETISRNLNIDSKKIISPYKIYLQNIYVIRGEDSIKTGEIFTDLEVHIDFLKPKIDTNKKYIIIRENVDSNLSEGKEYLCDYMYEEILVSSNEDFINNYKFQVIVYDP